MHAVYFSGDGPHVSLATSKCNQSVYEDPYLRIFCREPPSSESICLLSYSWFSSSKCRKLTLSNVCQHSLMGLRISTWGIIHNHNMSRTHPTVATTASEF